MMANSKDIEEFKYLIDSRNLSDAEKEKEKVLLAKARAERRSLQTEEDIKAAKLLQLKYKMEAYLENSACNHSLSFSIFLAEYVDTLYEKRKKFAEDVSVAPIMLSHIINQHREPQESFLKRLIVHSKDAFKYISEFDGDLWPRVYYQNKVCNFLMERHKWEKSEEKFVRSTSIKPNKI